MTSLMSTFVRNSCTFWMADANTGAASLPKDFVLSLTCLCQWGPGTVVMLLADNGSSHFLVSEHNRLILQKTCPSNIHHSTGFFSCSLFGASVNRRFTKLRQTTRKEAGEYLLLPRNASKSNLHIFLAFMQCLDQIEILTKSLDTYHQIFLRECKH